MVERQMLTQIFNIPSFLNVVTCRIRHNNRDDTLRHAEDRVYLKLSLPLLANLFEI